jgi:hypothetical protein
MTQIVLLLPLLIFLYTNYISVRNRSPYSWFCIVVWAFLSLFSFAIVTLYAKDFRLIVSQDFITIYLILTSMVIVGNIVVSLVFYFKK